MAKYDWFEEWDSGDSKHMDDYLSDESLLEGLFGYVILVAGLIGFIGALLQALWKPTLVVGVVWVGYESIHTLVEYVQGVL